MSNQIEIKIDGKKLTPEKFLEAAKSFFDLIGGVAKNVAAKPVNWAVESDKGSTIIRTRIQNPSDESRQVIHAICRGVRSLRSGNKTIPHGFTKNEIVASRRLTAIIDGDGVKSVSIKNGSAPEDLLETIIATADSILSGETSTAFGSIEGTLDSLSMRHGFSCSVYEPRLQREIICYFQKTEVEQEAYRGFGKRVLAGGLIRYAKEGYPTSISVDTIRIFPDESELPTIEEVQALFR
jgi:hypothetical protein